MWSRERALDAEVAPEQVWRRWIDLSCWPEDDPDTLSARLDGPPEVGSAGRVTPRRGPTSTVVVVRADPLERFDLDTRFPGAVMHFEHRLEAREPGCRLVHRVRFTGPLAWLWGPLIGAAIARGLPRVLANIVKHAGSGPSGYPS